VKQFLEDSQGRSSTNLLS